MMNWSQKCFEKTLTYMKENALDMAASGSTFIEADTMKVRGIRKIQENIILEEHCLKKFSTILSNNEDTLGKII